ncbi:HAD-superfamily hydrolase, subfamily IA, variant 1 [Haloterrigena turkmenica DSM 5511]|uniref:HAD-superfamily hydrolase, subfamily IA, variant 1 n=1 Tax=Haloterrigena turkmenica (strain ATCC 51198 / DSM 5511 / JCM 9101 / NCIMB 13204 / VKM B-1734 / 4k) TaxID=543526 RepID=D2RWN8_HALTV|nr:HAD-IA family hydrolase [Haloterrigena turkmenica]ADB61539.1 HAD-superfamily hydrolase, subfamily IA, variant 1 [Haloterrigena turkmenica DSM 5511]
MDAAYDAILFDNDGVLTTPTDREVLIDAMHDAFAAVGVVDPPSEHVRTVMGPSVDSLREVADAHDVDPHELWTAREHAAVAAQLEEIEGGRKRLYDDVGAVANLDGVATAIVSNNQHETIGNIVSHFDLDWLDTWYGREPTVKGIDRKKPTPYYLELALEELDVEDALFVGDSWVDVEAADAAGVDAAFLRRDHVEGVGLPREPTTEIESLEEIPRLL